MDTDNGILRGNNNYSRRTATITIVIRIKFSGAFH